MSVLNEKMVDVYCKTRDGMKVQLPEDVAAVLNLMGYTLYFGRSFCDVEWDAGEFNPYYCCFVSQNDDFDWVEGLIDWVRNGCPEKKK